MKSMLCKYYQPLRLEKPSNFRLVTMAGANVGFGDTHMFQQTAKTYPSKVTHLNRE